MALCKLLLIMRFLFIILIFSTAQAQPPMFKMLVKRQGCSLLLDCYPATAAYSTDKLRTAYSGSCMRVRRSSDNTEQDIGFSGNSIDTASLKTFVGTGGADDGFIVTYYDQSGNGNNATQSTQANQPMIIDNGVIYRQSTKPAAFFTDGLLHFWNVPNIHGSSTVDSYVVQNYTPTQWIQWEGAGAGGNYSYVSTSGSGSTTLYSNYGTPSLYVDGALFSGTTRGDIYNSLNGYHIATYQSQNVSTWTRYTFGGYSSFELGGYVGDIIIWTSSQSSNRSAILNNINSRWSVY